MLRSPRFLLVLALAWAGCDQPAPVEPARDIPPEVVEVSIDPAQLLLIVDGDSTLVAVARTANGAVVTGATFAWSSSGPEVASVDSTGRVVAHALGEAAIMARMADGTSASASVRVDEPPRLSLSRSSVAFTATEGEAAPSPEAIDVTNVGGGQLGSISATVDYVQAGVAWLAVSVKVDGSGTHVWLQPAIGALAPGSYQGTVIVSAGAAAAPDSVAVTLRLQPRVLPARLHTAPSRVDFAWGVGHPAPAPQSVRVTNMGGGELLDLTLEVTSSGPPWLNATLSTSESPADIRLEVVAQGLAAGVYTADVRVHAPGAENSPVSIPVTLAVTEGPLIGASVDEVLLIAPTGGFSRAGDPRYRFIDLFNAGAGSLQPVTATVRYAAGGAQGWLRAVLPPIVPATLAVEAFATTLGPGTHLAWLDLSAPNAPTRTLPVRLDVEDPADLVLEPDSLFLSITQGDPLIHTLETQITSVGAGPLLGELDGLHLRGPLQDVGPASFQFSSRETPSTLSLHLSPARLTPGVHKADVTVASTRWGVPTEVPLHIQVEVKQIPPTLFSTSGIHGSGFEGQVLYQSYYNLANHGAPALRGLQVAVDYGAGPAGWIRIGPLPDSIPAIPPIPNYSGPTPWIVDIPIELDLRRFPPGGYEARVISTAANAANGPQHLVVRYQVFPPQQVRLQPQSVDFDTAAVGGPAPPSQVVTVDDPGGGGLNPISNQLTYGPGAANWLVVEEFWYGGWGQLRLSANPSGLAPGTYSAQLEVSSPGAVNSPQAIDIRLVVVP